MKGEIHNTIIVGNVNTPLSAMDIDQPDRKSTRNIGLEPHFRSNKPNKHI